MIEVFRAIVEPRSPAEQFRDFASRVMANLYVAREFIPNDLAV